MKDLLNQAMVCEVQNDWGKAIEIYVNALQSMPNDKDILLNLAACLFNQGSYEQALEIYIRCYKHPLLTFEERQQLIQFILDAYYRPNEDTFRLNYDNNAILLGSYEHNYLNINNFPTFEELPFYCIPASENKFYILEKKSMTISGPIELTTVQNSYRFSPGDCVITVDVFPPAELEQIMIQTEDPGWINGLKVPLYVIWREKVLIYSFLQYCDFKEIISRGRCAFFDSFSMDSQFGNFLKDLQVVFPTQIISGEKERDSINQVLSEIFLFHEIKIKSLKALLFQEYGSYSRENYQELFQGSPENLRILFYTSRFTLVVQYSTRDFMRACEKLGIQCEYLIDKSDIHRANELALMERIVEFKPNIVFRINFFKQDYGDLPENLMFVTWIQDPGHQMYSTEYARKFGINDYIMTATKDRVDTLINTGFPQKRVTFETIPFNDSIFQPYTLTDSEINHYASDVAVCANYTLIPKDLITEWINGSIAGAGETNPELSRKINCFFTSINNYLEALVEQDELIKSAEQCRLVMEQLCLKLSITINAQHLANLASNVFENLAYSIHRKYVIKALIEAGIHLKLWGRHWEKEAEFVPYALGWVQHGEELAKVYSGTKIVIGTFSHFTGHFRIWEAVSCGSLCMVRFVPPEFDAFDIRDFLNEGDGFVFYHNKQDLVEKIRYYLENEDERKRIIANGQKKVKEKLTYSAIAKNMLDFIKYDLETN